MFLYDLRILVQPHRPGSYDWSCERTGDGDARKEWGVRKRRRDLDVVRRLLSRQTCRGAVGGRSASDGTHVLERPNTWVPSLALRPPTAPRQV